MLTFFFVVVISTCEFSIFNSVWAQVSHWAREAQLQRTATKNRVILVAFFLQSEWCPQFRFRPQPAALAPSSPMSLFFPCIFSARFQQTSLPGLLYALEFAAVAPIRMGVWFPGMCKSSLLFLLPQCLRSDLGLTPTLTDRFLWNVTERGREVAATQTKAMNQVS